MKNNFLYKKKKISLNYIMIFIIITMFLTPYFIRNVPRVFQIVIVILWYVSALFEKKLFIKKTKYLFLQIVIWQTIEIFYRIFGFSSADWGNYLMNIFTYTTVIMGFCINEGYEILRKRRIVKFGTFVMVVNIIDNIYLSYKYPNAQVDINYGWGMSYLSTNVAQTWFYAETMLFVGTILLLFFYAPTKKSKIFSLLILVASVFFLFAVSPRATACVFVIALFIILLITYRSNGNITKIWILTIIILLVFILLAEPTLSFLISNVAPERLSERLTGVLDFVKGYSSGDNSFSERILYARTSLETFVSSFNSFLFGIGYHVSSNSIAIGIGQHSTVIDMLAKYGLCGAVMFYWILIKSCKNMQSLFTHRSTRALISMIILTFAFYAVVNNIVTPGIFTVVFIITLNIESWLKIPDNNSTINAKMRS